MIRNSVMSRIPWIWLNLEKAQAEQTLHPLANCIYMYVPISKCLTCQDVKGSTTGVGVGIGMFRSTCAGGSTKNYSSGIAMTTPTTHSAQTNHADALLQRNHEPTIRWFTLMSHLINQIAWGPPTTTTTTSTTCLTAH